MIIKLAPTRIGDGAALLPGAGNFVRLFLLVGSSKLCWVSFLVQQDVLLVLV